MSDRRQRELALKLRVTATERAVIRKAADAAQVSVASFIRDAAVTAAKSEPEIKSRSAIARHLRDLVAELHRVGQVVKTGLFDQEDADRVVSELQRMQRLLFHFYYDESKL